MVSGSFLFFCALLAWNSLNPWNFIGTFEPSKIEFWKCFGSLLEIQIGTDLIISKKPILANRLLYLFAEMLRMCCKWLKLVLHSDRRARFIVKIYYKVVAPLLANNSRSIENVSVLNTADGLACSYTFIIVSKRITNAARRCGSESSTVAPSEGVCSAVVVREGVTYRIVSYCCSVECGKSIIKRY